MYMSVNRYSIGENVDDDQAQSCPKTESVARTLDLPDLHS